MSGSRAGAAWCTSWLGLPWGTTGTGKTLALQGQEK